MNKGYSGKELIIREFIESNYKGKIEYNNRDFGKELDIYIPDLKLAIEYNGLYWHNELYKSKIYHKEKTEMCEKNDIQLLHIWEDDLNYRPDIIKSTLLNKLNKSNKIYARKCILKEIKDNSIVRDFLFENHIQGFVGSNVKLGLYYNNELVSLMTFGKTRKHMGNTSIEGEYEMIRFCNKKVTSVIGGASKLLKYFIRNYNPHKIITYADRSYSKGNLYTKIGFTFEHDTEPNYYYVSRDVRKSRFNYRKDVLVSEGYDSDKSEHEIMLERNIYRIYDAGHKKYILNL